MALSGWDSNKKIRLEVSPNLPDTYITGRPWIEQLGFNTEQTGNITPWSLDTPLLGPLSNFSAAVIKNKVYIFGGADSGVRTSNILCCDINTDGTLGTWSIVGNLPATLIYSTCIITKGFVYLLGGYTNTYTSNIYGAAINFDGTLGSWSIVGNLPSGLYWSSVAIAENRIYMVGGRTSSTKSYVYTCRIQSDGTLGAWDWSTNYPIAVMGLHLLYTKNKLYGFGGLNSSGVPINSIYMATTSDDGYLTSGWSLVGTLPATIGDGKLLTTANRAYLLMGKLTTSAFSSNIYSAPIASDGTVGSWALDNDTISGYGVSGFEVVATDSKLYILGGAQISTYDRVLSSNFSGGLKNYSEMLTTKKVGNITLPIKLSDNSGIDSTDLSMIFSDVGANFRKIALEIGDTGEECYLEVPPAQWDHTNNKGVIWANIPGLLLTSFFNLYYDSAHSDNTDHVGSTGETAAQLAWSSDIAFVTLQGDPSSNILDSTDNAAVGTTYGSMTTGDLIDGLTGKLITLDGIDDYANFGYNADLDVYGNITIEVAFIPGVEFNSSMGKYQGLLSRRDIPGSYEPSYSFFINDYGSLSFTPYPDCPISTNQDVWEVGKEYYVAVSFNNPQLLADLFAYNLTDNLGGIASIIYSNLYNMGTSLNDLVVGNWSDSDVMFEGAIGFIRISNETKPTAHFDTMSMAFHDTLFSFSTNAVTLTAALNVIDQIWSSIGVRVINSIDQKWSVFEQNVIEQLWSIMGYRVENYIDLKWAVFEQNIIDQLSSDAQRALNVIHRYWSNAKITVKRVDQIWSHNIRTIKAIHQLYNITSRAQNVVDQVYTITQEQAINVISQIWNLHTYQFTQNNIDQIWSLISGQTSITEFAYTDPNETPSGDPSTPDTVGFSSGETVRNIKAFSVVVNGMFIPVNLIQIDRDEDRYTIDATITVIDPNYFYLFDNENVPVAITVNTTVYHLITRSVTETISKGSVILNVLCKSRSCLLDANTTVTLKKEFRSELASVLFAELASIEGITVDWAIYHNNALVDGRIREGTLVATSETPLAIMRKILEAIGGKMLSQPDGTLKVVHQEPTRVPDYATVTPDVILTNVVRTEGINISKTDNPKYNVVFVSDQLTSEKTYSVESEDVSSIRKLVKGYHTPWDSEEVVLKTSGGSSVVVSYNGYETVPYPKATEEPELVTILNGVGNSSKPIYGIQSYEYVKDPLGSITFSEDGSIETEIKEHSLIRLRYLTRYHKWTVESPNVSDVLCVLEPKV